MSESRTEPEEVSSGKGDRGADTDFPLSWPHAPPHFVASPGTFMVTAGTYGKAPRFGSRKRLRFLCGTLLETAERHGWRLEAWAVFANHYHWIGKSPGTEEEEISEMREVRDSLRDLTAELHRRGAIWVNGLDGTPERKVWHNFWDSALSYEKSYLARLRYVMENPVKHGLVTRAEHYPWCSAGWFQLRASAAFQKSLGTFKIDRLKVPDEF